MTTARLAAATVTALILVAIVAAFALVDHYSTPQQAPAIAPSGPAAAEAEAHPGFLYGRITADGATYEGRLRWGGDQEAFWGDYFDGAKHENPWAVHMPGAQQRSPIEIFGFEIGGPDRPNFSRPFMTRFGDIARVEASFGTTKVTLKSGTTFELDRFSAGDIDDGVRVWDLRQGVRDVDARDIRTIEFLPTPPLVAAPARLHGTVKTKQGDFTGFIQWNREDGAGDDELSGRTAGREVSLRYDTIRSIARRSSDSAVVTLVDGAEMVLSDGGDVGRGNRGIYVDDPRYSQVLIYWDAFERVEFSPGGSGPAYTDFPPGRPIAGSVTTRDGRRLAGRLVYDFDEGETTDTLDGHAQGVDYNIPFGLIASIGRRDGSVTLHNGEALQLDRSGDFGPRNAGLLIFVAGRDRPEHVPWTDVEQIALDRP